MSEFPRAYTPEDYSERLVELAEALMQARQRVEMEVLARNRAEQALGEHLRVPTGEERIALVGEWLLHVHRSGDAYFCEVRRIHAIAQQELS